MPNWRIQGKTKNRLKTSDSGNILSKMQDADAQLPPLQLRIQYLEQEIFDNQGEIQRRNGKDNKF